MIDRGVWQGKRVLVLGMARSGVAVAQLLCRYGATPLLNDRKTESELGEALDVFVTCVQLVSAQLVAEARAAGAEA